MRKVWIYKRKNTKGWWVGWYEGGIRKTKAVPTKALADHFRHIKYTQLNSDIFTGTVTVDWEQMRQEYRHCKKVSGFVEGSLYESALTLRHFERIIGKCNSKQITQHTLDQFILKRKDEVKRSTLNKDIRNLKAFINWCRENRYLNGEIKIKLLKEDEKPVKSLNRAQIKKLLLLSRRYPTMHMRILLALGTGLRRGDIESLKIADVDFSSSSVTTKSKKTRKSMGSRPVPIPVMEELKKYVSELKPQQEHIFTDNFSHCRWDTLRKVIGVSDLRFHDLRKVFCSILAQRGISTAVTQRLLEHSSPDLTNKVYTNVDPVLRHAVDQIPVGDWL
ncbi:tyrosine-type recombinase/integrase [Planctomycetota bacterium]